MIKGEGKGTWWVMAIRTGTADTRTTHSMGTAVVHVVLAAGVPPGVAVAGIAVRGWDAIAWGAALLWGGVAAGAMLTLFALGRATGLTRMDLADLLGSFFAGPKTRQARTTGVLLHVVDGALLGVAFAYGLELLGLLATWATGMLWGVVLWLLAMILMSSIGALHPAIRRGDEPDPGPVARHFGPWTPVGSLLGHAVYGILLGVLYQVTPF